jgi:hypothetical protein
MLRLALLLLYLFASSSLTPQEKQGGSLDPLGLTPPPHGGSATSTGPTAPAHTDQGGSLDPIG